MKIGYIRVNTQENNTIRQEMMMQEPRLKILSSSEEAGVYAIAVPDYLQNKLWIY